MTWNRIRLLTLLVVAACGGDKARDEAPPSAGEGGATASGISPDEYRKRQQAFADSMLNSVASAKAVVDKLGKGYAVGSVRLRDSVAAIAARTDCFAVGRKTDPYLAGTVSVFVNMSVIGTDVVRVQESKWTSLAGNLVDACLNQEARNWKFDTSFGKPATYIVQVQFK